MFFGFQVSVSNPFFPQRLCLLGSAEFRTSDSARSVALPDTCWRGTSLLHWNYSSKTEQRINTKKLKQKLIQESGCPQARPLVPVLAAAPPAEGAGLRAAPGSCAARDAGAGAPEPRGGGRRGGRPVPRPARSARLLRVQHAVEGDVVLILLFHPVYLFS